MTVETLLPQSDAAAYLHLGERTLERWRVTGTGPEYVKVGKKVFYTEAGLAAYIERCRRQSTSERAAA
jgi:hypothetical protein